MFASDGAIAAVHIVAAGGFGGELAVVGDEGQLASRWISPEAEAEM